MRVFSHIFYTIANKARQKPPLKINNLGPTKLPSEQPAYMVNKHVHNVDMHVQIIVQLQKFSD